jgi:hypothetical protein
VIAVTVAPNPLRGRARISYSLPCTGKVSIRLFDPVGRLAADLGSGLRPAGVQIATVDARRLHRGVYILRLETPAGSAVRKLVIE